MVSPRIQHCRQAGLFITYQGDLPAVNPLGGYLMLLSLGDNSKLPVVISCTSYTTNAISRGDWLIRISNAYHMYLGMCMHGVFGRQFDLYRHRHRHLLDAPNFTLKGLRRLGLQRVLAFLPWPRVLWFHCGFCCTTPASLTGSQARLTDHLSEDLRVMGMRAV